MKKVILFCLSLIAACNLAGAFVFPAEAVSIGCGIFQAMTGSSDPVYRVTEYYSKSDKAFPSLYIIRFEPAGFLLLAADDRSQPILAFSETNQFSEGNLQPNLKYMLDNYSEGIYDLKKKNECPVNPEWSLLREGNFSAYVQDAVRNINLSDMIPTWGQTKYYNNLCPQDGSVQTQYNGHVPAGCAAVAMAQIIRYHEQPYRGSGSNSYTPETHPEYGVQTVNFENARYDHTTPLDTLTTYNNDVARLIYHCGVAVNMDYGPQGSSASIDSVASAFVNHFRFNSADIGNRNSFEDPLWMMMLRTELDAGRPIYYRGETQHADPDSVSGHAFVLQGYVVYSNQYYFYINWGWNGNSNGQFSLSPIPVFTQDQSAIFNLYPLPQPNSPSNLTLNNSSPFSLQFSWVDNSSNEEGFHIERRLGGVGAEWVGIASVGANVTSYLDGGLTSGYIYNYRVRSFNANGFSEYSNELNTSTPLYERVIDSSIEQFSPSMVYISWNPQPNAHSYALYSADEPLPTEDPGWTLVTEGAIYGYYASTTTDRKFYHVKVKLIMSAPSDFIYVPGGTFTMGRTTGSGDSDELPTHTVTLNSFYIGKYEVTQAEYSQYMPNPGWESRYGLGDNYPAYGVSWYAILKYCNLRSMAEGLTPCYTINGSTNPANWGAVPTSNNSTWNAAICNWNANGYRLPTEAEWEYAARGATNNPDYLYSGSDDLSAVAWHWDNSGSTTHTVGTNAPNGIGTYDMSGNVWEWCWDWYSSSYYSSSPQDNPTGPASGSYRMRRGGSWNANTNYCSVSRRWGRSAILTDGDDGFRLCRAAN